MERQFIRFEEAVEQLGISAEKLNELREAGQLRAYRDGASWKFRADEIDRLAAEGLPDLEPLSDIGLAEPPSARSADLSDLRLADDDEALDLELPSDADEATPGSDSILLSEEELGEGLEQPPSTIIGKHDQADADLQLADEEPALSDVKLAAGASDVLSSGIVGGGVLDAMETQTGNAFENLPELDIELEEESRIQVGGAPAVGGSAASTSDVGLEDLDLVGSDVAPAGAAGGAAAPPSPGGSDLSLEDEDDFVLADGGGSDITLDSADSGINLIEPADSGVALDDMPLDIGGSAILSSLSLDQMGSDAELSLVSDSDKAGGDDSLAELQTEEDFRLTPLADGGLDDQDSSSQVIALDAEGVDLGAADGGMLGDDAFGEGVAEDNIAFDEGYAGDAVSGLEASPYGAVSARADSEYTLMNLLGLGSAALLLLLSALLLLDIVRNIWSWNEPYALTSPLLESLCGLFGLK